MGATHDDRKGFCILRCEGRLDATTYHELEEDINKLIDKNQIKILLDFTHVDYLSSAGMRLLLSKTRKLKMMKGKLVLFAIHEMVESIIRIAGFEGILNICTTEQEAIDSL